jgi:hypothetical protein
MKSRAITRQERVFAKKIERDGSSLFIEKPL